MFSKNMKEIMVAKKITGAMLARETGYSKAAISQYINGINVPSQKRVEAIAAVLDVAVEELTAVPDRKSTEPPCGCTARPYARQKTTLTCYEAAALLHKHVSYVRKGIRLNRPGFEYGSATPPDEGKTKWSYCIYASKFTEITGIPVND